MEITNELQYAKVLEDRLNNIENSYGSSVFESPINVIQARLVDDVEEIGLDYLLNYQTVRLGMAINMSVYAAEFFPIINETEKYKEDKNGIELRQTNRKDDFVETINRRRSVRKFSGEKIAFETFSNIIGGAQDTQKVEKFVFRTTPSGGGLYPIDTYFYANNINELENGIYLYNPINKSLKLIKKNCQNEVFKILENQTVLDIKNSGGVFFFVYDYTKNYQKYGNLAMALGFIEIGAIAQTIHILSTYYTIGSCDIGGFDKVLCETCLGVDGINKHAVYALAIGGKADVEIV